METDTERLVNETKMAAMGPVDLKRIDQPSNELLANDFGPHLVEVLVDRQLAIHLDGIDVNFQCNEPTFPAHISLRQVCVRSKRTGSHDKAIQ